MDGRHAFPDTKAERSKCGDELERPRLQPEAGHENSRYQRFNEGAVGLKRSVFWPPTKVEAALRADSASARFYTLWAQSGRQKLQAGIVSWCLCAPYSGNTFSVKGMAMNPLSGLPVGVIGSREIVDVTSHCAKRVTPCVQQ